MFSANPRGWRTVELSAAACEAFREARSRFTLAPVAIHANYLINLASSDAVIGALSVAAFRSEIERAVALGADYLVVHPGCAKDSERKLACRTVVDSVARALTDFKPAGLTRCSGGVLTAERTGALDAAVVTPSLQRVLNGGPLMLLLENTAGQGTSLGADLDELAEILAGVSRLMPSGVCLDTAHLFAAGYPVHTARGLGVTIRRIEASVGLANVRLIHANDSKTPLGSHVDRHQHIGRGHIGHDGFKRIVRHPKLRRIPFICETPIDKPGDDRRNVRVIRSLAAD